MNLTNIRQLYQNTQLFHHVLAIGDRMWTVIVIPDIVRNGCSVFFLFISLFLWVGTAKGEPVVDGVTVRNFLGGRTGKLVYTKFEGEDSVDNGRSLWYVDFDDDQLVERRVLLEDSCEPRNAIISPDGEWVTYNTTIKYDTVITRRSSFDTITTYKECKSYLCRLEENALEKIFIDDGAHPHWWTKPGTNEEYIIYNTRDMETCWITWVQFCDYERISLDDCITFVKKLENKRPVGNWSILLPCFGNGGRSKNGKWMFSSGRTTIMYEIDPLITDSAEPKRTIYDIKGCNPSMSPHENDSAIRVMYLNVPHDGFYIADVFGDVKDSIMKDPSDGNRYWDTPEWSTHKDFAAAVASPMYSAPPFDIYLYRTTDHSVLRVLDGNYHLPHLWVENKNPVKKPRYKSDFLPGSNLYITGVTITVVNGNSNSVVISIADLKGRIVSRYASKQNVIRYIPDLNSGIYVVNVTIDGKMSQKVFMRH